SEIVRILHLRSGEIPSRATTDKSLGVVFEDPLKFAATDSNSRGRPECSDSRAHFVADGPRSRTGRVCCVDISHRGVHQEVERQHGGERELGANIRLPRAESLIRVGGRNLYEAFK